jgi:hypothetical protein
LGGYLTCNCSGFYMFLQDIVTESDQFRFTSTYQTGRFAAHLVVQ